MRSVDLVDPFIGTDSCFTFSNGNTLPVLALPWGCHHWSPANAVPDRWFFQYRDRRFHGLRLTHQPSPWMNDGCCATIMPQSGARRLQQAERAVDLPSKALDCRPHRFGCHLPSEGIDWDAAPTSHALRMRLRWRGSGPRRLIIDSARSELASEDRGAHASAVRVDPRRGEISLRTRLGSDMHPDFAMHLLLRCGASAIGGGLFDADGAHDEQLQGEGAALGAWLELPPGGGELDVEIAASFIDADAARALLDSQVAGRSLERVAEDGAACWDALLDRLELPGADDQLLRLTRSLQYRTLLFPRRIDEPDHDGEARHRCPDTGQVRRGVRLCDNGFWDTARTVYPWYALLYPDHLPSLLDGWLAGARSSGHLSCWSSPGHRNGMTGTYIDAVFADALSRGIDGWDLHEALYYLRQHCEQPVADDAPYGRVALDAYLHHGFVPHERIGKATARTLDYAYGDWCIARVAEAAGDHDLAASCAARAGNWRNVLDPGSDFFRGRHADGSWLQAFDPCEWGGPFVEGSAWQFAWHVPHQPRELIAARGGPARALAFLKRLLAEPPQYRVGSYPHVIHEMREMAAVDFGQYAHSNQPSHLTLPYLAHCDDAGGWQHWMGRVRTELYRPTPDGLCGDEDNGELSAWWLCAALGLFPDCPGSGRWLTLRPLFEHAVLRVPGRAPLTLHRSADAASIWTGPDGRRIACGRHVAHERIAAGGYWRCDEPSSARRTPDAPPPLRATK